jgi:hypothetical protein
MMCNTKGDHMKKFLLLIICMMVFHCANKQVVKFDRYSVSMNLPIESDSTIYIGTPEKFVGVLSLVPILKAENVSTNTIKLIENYGKFYVCADQFKNLWLIEPLGDGLTAQYKALDVTPEDKTDSLTDTGFARYGSGDKVCIKFRFNKKEVFINKKGVAHDICE